MKISSGQLAQALLQSIAGKDKDGIKEAAANLAKLLGERHMLGKEQEIIEAFSRLWDEENGVVETRVSVSHPLSEANRRRIDALVKERTGAKEVIITEEEDASQLGGIAISYGDKVARAGLKGWIAELGTRLSN